MVIDVKVALVVWQSDMVETKKKGITDVAPPPIPGGGANQGNFGVTQLTDEENGLWFWLG